MTKIISVHSFRGGTGKSNLSANLAYLLFSSGKRVGVIDGDIASPGVHVLFGVDESKLEYTLNDYLWERCSIEQTATQVVENLFLIPSSLSASEIAKILREGYNVEKLVDGIHEAAEKLKLDYLILDTHPGINEETLLSISISDLLVVVMRPDSQDYQGTAVAVELAKKLEVPQMFLLVNKCLPSMDAASIMKQAEETYEIPVAGVLPFCEDLMLLGSSKLFTQEHPDHFVTNALREVMEKIQ